MCCTPGHAGNQLLASWQTSLGHHFHYVQNGKLRLTKLRGEQKPAIAVTALTLAYTLTHVWDDAEPFSTLRHTAAFIDNQDSAELQASTAGMVGYIVTNLAYMQAKHNTKMLSVNKTLTGNLSEFGMSCVLSAHYTNLIAQESLDANPRPPTDPGMPRLRRGKLPYFVIPPSPLLLRFNLA